MGRVAWILTGVSPAARSVAASDWAVHDRTC